MENSRKGRKYIFAVVPTTANNLMQLLTDLRMEREAR